MEVETRTVPAGGATAPTGERGDSPRVGPSWSGWRQLVTFAYRTLSDFRKNQGVLLSGAIAYYTLLSIVPLFALLLLGLSRLVDKEQLLETLRINLELLLPGQSAAITEQIASFLAHPEIVGGIGVVVLLFFSAMAFTVLENAMSIIFHHRVAIHRRHFLVSALIPYLFISLLGVGLLLVTTISVNVRAIGRGSLWFFGHAWSLTGITGFVVYLLGATGLVCMLTALYMVMPVGRLAFRHALLGAVTATALWEVTRHVLAWYLTTLSMVNVVYGSLAGAVVVLLTLEVAALILLLGAQVIAEAERWRQARGLRDSEGLRL